MRTKYPQIVTFSFALVVLFSLFGYGIAAPYIAASGTEGSAPSIVLRAITACSICAFLLMKPMRNKLIWPILLFLILYGARLADLYYLRNEFVYVPPLMSFSFLLIGSALPIAVLASRVHLIATDTFRYALIFIISLFLFGLALNYDTLIGSMGGRAQLSKLNPIYLGTMATTFLLALMAMQGGGKWVLICRIVLAIPLVAVVGLAGSRGPIVGLVFSVIAYILIFSRRPMKLVLAISAAGLVSASLAYNEISRFLEQALYRFTTEGRGVEHDTVIGRIKSYQAAWEQFWKSPIIGNHVQEPILNTYPHNLFLETLISLGLVGAIILFAIIIIVLVKIRAIGSYSGPGAWIGHIFTLFFLQYFVQAQFSSAIWSNTMLWISMSLVLGYSEFLRSGSKMTLKSRRPSLGSKLSHPLSKQSGNQNREFFRVPRAPTSN